MLPAASYLGASIGLSNSKKLEAFRKYGKRRRRRFYKSYKIQSFQAFGGYPFIGIGVAPDRVM
jgi:hypothetical protein